MHVIEGLSDLHEVRMRVGALPEFPANALKYYLTWSTDGLINEYIQPCKAVIDGVLTHVPALESLKLLRVGIRQQRGAIHIQQRVQQLALAETRRLWHRRQSVRPRAAQ